MAIDGDFGTWSVTAWLKDDAWWEAQLKKRATVVRVELHLSTVAYQRGAYKHMKVIEFLRTYLMGPYNAGPYLTPAPLTPALITPVSNCVEYKKVYISAFNGDIRQKIS